MQGVCHSSCTSNPEGLNSVEQDNVAGQDNARGNIAVMRKLRPTPYSWKFLIVLTNHQVILFLEAKRMSILRQTL